MLKSIYYNVISPWNLWRVIRAGIGAWAIFEGFRTHDNLLIAAGGFLGTMALLNMGCCGAAGCGVNSRKVDSKKEIEFEEVEGR
jgi:hypothetical protein